MNSHTQINIFGLPIEGVDEQRVIERIERHQGSYPYWIVTTNPEILLYAYRHPDYEQTLAKADLRTVDSVGLKLIGALRRTSLHRLTGVDLAEDLVKWAHQKQYRVGILGGGALKSATPALRKLQDRYPGLQGLAEDGGHVSTEGDGDDATEEAWHRLTIDGPEVLLVAFGHPKQERWIEKHLEDMPSVKVVVGVGGTLDYWSEHLPRPPKWIRNLGLEWLYRLLTQPRRWKRILNAVIVFPLVYLTSKR
ncbi:WecB/TagA/CpsF family glycosyltransferase [Candidatus Uhrbacteria bacterium]|nr:WecB/TagA/CpsF family glycosyltransferase [Candidatus Uhrbacteria bacterium]MBD3284206.1 WecB/TagA/CpsF family glycosyltransferase [Candidatus Uhrbacteria bacterium]